MGVSDGGGPTRGGSDPGPRREGFKKNHLGDGPSLTTSLSSSFLESTFPFPKNAILTRGVSGQVEVEGDPGGLRPQAQGFRSMLLARLAWPWEAKSGRVYPGQALPEQMGTCQCRQLGARLMSPHCQVAGDSGAWRGTCVCCL